ncbi:ADP-heptose--LPS heptosyltransferase II [Oceaniovalibus guishaninsula JLT2003]|uniref:ADP-heptose--LPS heptosyltransferase II n=1 Tax=Oceaniovalibus guishaninsula JLT2003 TaxID=1231392 RepID=K2HLR2_9RHOB|nr:glycosyltransferase family 9 protein [Oceaniovalibus guishaninsula]EKE43844.1 ADP-heptose--LPS heptosyltransferase II [Oceaniovalibus guishaninsula JLT2003]
MTAAGWDAARRVLAVRLDAMGDVLMTAPALAAIKGSGAGTRHLTLLTSPAGAAVARLIPAIDDVIVYRAPWSKLPPGTLPDPDADLALIEMLRARRFDAAAIFTVHSQSALPATLICHLAGIPLRLAYCRENPYDLLTDWVRETEPAAHLRHEARRQIDLVASVGLRGPEAPGLVLPASAERAAAARLRALGLDGSRNWCVLHPGASAPSRRAPLATFVKAAEILTQRHGWRILVTGHGAEATLADRIATLSGVAATGPMELPDLAALIARAPVLVTNNTGPAHLAAALGTPVVDLYALTNLQHAPWKAKGRVLFRDVPCRVCLKSVCPEGHHRCLADIDPAEVAAAALECAGGAAPAIPEDPARIFGRDGITRGADEARDLPASVA